MAIRTPTNVRSITKKASKALRLKSKRGIRLFMLPSGTEVHDGTVHQLVRAVLPALLLVPTWLSSCMCAVAVVYWAMLHSSHFSARWIRGTSDVWRWRLSSA